MNLDIEQMIYTSVMYCNTNVREIARIIGMSPSNLYRKIRCNTLRSGELSKIAEALGGEYLFCFSFPNGTKIGKLEKPKRKGIKSDKKKQGPGINCG